VEQAPGGGADALAVVGIHRGIGEDHTVRARRVRRAQHGAGVARVADVDQDRHQPRRCGGQAGQRDVHIPANGKHSLRGDGLCEPGHHLAADGLDVRPLPGRLVGELGVPGAGGGGDEQLRDDAAAAERLPYRLRPLGQERPRPQPQRPLGQLAGRLHLG
jgi:hypothetical protein